MQEAMKKLQDQHAVAFREHSLNPEQAAKLG